MKEVFIADTYHELSSQIGSFMEDHDIYDYENVTIVIGKVKDDLANDEYYWKATLTPKPTADTLKDMLVEEHGVVGLFWNKEDIIELAAQDKRRELTSEEVDEIARQLANNDCEYGINWQTIREITMAVCPDAVSMDDEDNEEDESDELRHIAPQYTLTNNNF